MKAKLLAILCALTILISAVPAASALEGEATRAADTLATLGLVNGNNDGDYDLESPATRAQAAVLLVRLAGAVEAAKEEIWIAGFRDLPGWAADSIDYSVHRGWLAGVTPIDFHPNATIDAGAWFGALLRMLGYTDVNEKDFTLADAAQFARRIGLTSRYYGDNNMTRGDLFLSTQEALSFPYKDGSGTVLEHLLNAGSVSRISANALGMLTPELTARQVADRYTAAVVRLDVFHSAASAKGNRSDSNASAFFISADGIAVTNCHAIKGAHSATATLITGDTYPVESVLFMDKDIDIAVLKISMTSTTRRATSAFAHLDIAPSGTTDIRAGETVYALGNPLGLGLAISDGIISDPTRIVQSYNRPCIMDTTDTSHGSSGGALLNTYGQVIGVTTGAYAYGNNMYLAVPIDPVLEADLTAKTLTVAQAGDYLAMFR